MAQKLDWLPQNHEALYNQSSLTKQYLNENLEGLGISGTSAAWVQNNFNPTCDAYGEAFLAWQNPAERTPLKTTALKTAKDTFTPVYRQLYTGFLKNNPNVRDEDLVAMGLPARPDKKPTPAPAPTTTPEAEVELPSRGVVTVHFRDKGATKKAKPTGVHGAEIAWAVLDTPPVDWSELNNSAFDTQTPYQFTFDGSQRGKKLYFALRWENTRGVKGNWSEIYETVIP